MAATALVQARLDPKIKARAASVLKKLGLSVSDAVRMLLTRTANEGALPLQPTPQEAAYDAWFRARVQEALNDPRPGIPDAIVKMEMDQRKAELRARPQAHKTVPATR